MKVVVVVPMFLLLFSTLYSYSFAKDFGVIGESFQIKETNMIDYLKSKLVSLPKQELSAFQEKIQRQILSAIKRPNPIKNISKAKYNKKFEYDPTYTVGENILDANDLVIYREGEKINPLDMSPFEEEWIFIDGDDQEQVSFSKLYSSKLEGKKLVKIILVKGFPGEQEDGSFFYFDQAGRISNKINITKVPSIVRQHPIKKVIEIEEVAL